MDLDGIANGAQVEAKIDARSLVAFLEQPDITEPTFIFLYALVCWLYSLRIDYTTIVVKLLRRIGYFLSLVAIEPYQYNNS